DWSSDVCSSDLKWIPSRSARRTSRRASSRSTSKFFRAGLRTERLEDRTMPAIFTVANLADSGPGSLRAAISSANLSAGADTIQFGVTGQINVLTALPSPTDTTGGPP